jgi:cobalt transporter subunit CbtB
MTKEKAMSEAIHNQQAASVQSNKKNQILATALLGLLILSVLSLAPMEVIHNATHDVRHSSGFPCH